MRSDGRPWHGGRVLVCDDNLLMAKVVAEFLRECGLEPMGPVGRLESAMQMARERALDGAILDINLNGRPCFPVCAILSARRIPFVFLTCPCSKAHPAKETVCRRSVQLMILAYSKRALSAAAI
jgi:CheY-like chemotaxis protein